MFIIYSLLYLILFIIAFFLLTIFIKFKIILDGEFIDKKINGRITIYWIKYLLSVSVSMKTKKRLQILIRLFYIPIKFSISLKKKSKNKKSTDQILESKKDINRKNKKETDDKKLDTDNKITKIKLLYIKNKSRIYFYKELFIKNILIIWKKYMQIKLTKLNANVGLSNPADTGKISGYLYALPINLEEKNINLTWDYCNKRYDTELQLKIIMKLYGILFRILLTWIEVNRYKKRSKIDD